MIGGSSLGRGNWTPNIYIPSGVRVAQLYPQALGAHFSRLLRHHWMKIFVLSVLIYGHSAVNILLQVVPRTS
jgi:hypothetical protein